MGARTPRLLHLLGAALVVVLSCLGAPVATAAPTPLPASLSDVRVDAGRLTASVTVRGTAQTATIDPASVRATLDGRGVPVTVLPATQAARSTMLVIDTSGSMGRAGMATVRSAVADFLSGVPSDVAVGVVSFATTSGVDLAPTRDRAAVQRVVDGLVSRGETSLHSAVDDAVKALGTNGERSMVLLSDGGDTIAADPAAARAASVEAVRRAKVRVEVIAFRTDETDTGALDAFARAGGGSVAAAGNEEAARAAFAAAARALDSQATLRLDVPAGVTGQRSLTVEGLAGGVPFTATTTAVLTGPTAAPSVTTSPAPSTAPAAASPTRTGGPDWWLLAGVGALFLGVFGLVVALTAPVFRSRRAQRLAAIEAYGSGATRGATAPTLPTPSALSQQLIGVGDRVMSGRQSTTRTLALLERADLPWRAGEWLILRLVAVVLGVTVGLLFLRSQAPWLGLLLGGLAGVAIPALLLRFLARRRANAFERQLPDVLMLVATSLSSGFSLPQAVDAVARDSAEPAAKEFSRALAETRIGADLADALERTALRMDSDNLHWAVMAIRIQREVGGNLAETLRTTTKTLREREQLRGQVRALSAEGRLSAYILIALPVGLFLYMLKVNYDYVSLLWTTLLGIAMLGVGAVAMVIGILWMRKVVQIEV
jgi:tight adherence protein B